MNADVCFFFFSSFSSGNGRLLIFVTVLDAKVLFFKGSSQFLLFCGNF